MLARSFGTEIDLLIVSFGGIDCTSQKGEHPESSSSELGFSSATFLLMPTRVLFLLSSSFHFILPLPTSLLPGPSPRLPPQLFLLLLRLLLHSGFLESRMSKLFAFVVFHHGACTSAMILLTSAPFGSCPRITRSTFYILPFFLHLLTFVRPSLPPLSSSHLPLLFTSSTVYPSTGALLISVHDRSIKNLRGVEQ